MINTTRTFNQAKVVVLYHNKQEYSNTTDISPEKPFFTNFTIPVPVEENSIEVVVFSSDGETILEYQPREIPQSDKPVALTSPPKPEDVETIEELYLHGLRLNQFHNASIDPMPYYFEALKRDQGDYRVNTQLGILFAKGKDFDTAEKYLQKAVERITMRYTRPKDSEALYYLGVVQRRLNKHKEAYDNLYAASWNAGWHTQSYHQLAEMDCEKGDYLTALQHIDKALSTNQDHLKGLGLKTVILRYLGQYDDAEKLAREILSTDPLDYTARNELSIILRTGKPEQESDSVIEELEKVMAGRIESYLEFSTFYANAGFFAEAIEILSRIEKKGNQYPMLFYYLGYYHSRMNNLQKAEEYFAMARSKPHDYCFPFREESITVLEEALKNYPGDAMAHYYLGNLYYEERPAKAVEMWEKSQNANDNFFIVWRNLALAAKEHDKDLKKAASLYEEAFSRNRSDNRLMFEYDQMLAESGETPEIRFTKIYKNNREISSLHSGTLLREIELLLFLGEYDEVAGIIEKTSFVESEGSRVFRDVYHNTYILLSMEKAEKGEITGAVTDLQKALDFPIGRWGSERRAQMNYLKGTYLEKLGKTEEAIKSYETAASENVERSEYLFEKGLAYQKLGKTKEAAEQFRMLAKLAERSGDTDAFRSFESGRGIAIQNAQNSYLNGLSLLSQGKKQEAQIQFAKALKLNPAHLWAKIMVASD